MNHRPPSNFLLLKVEFADFIDTIHDGDKRNPVSTALAQRKTIRFKGSTSVLYCYEVLTQIQTATGGKVIIEKSYYDWEDKNGRTLLKIHSEPHHSIDYQTATEPHHTHPSNPVASTDRLPNYYHQELGAVIELIRYQLSTAMERVVDGLTFENQASATDELKCSE